MTQKQMGWTILAAALGSMFTLMAVDISQLSGWHEATTPAFVGSMVAHLGTVLGAFVGGKLIPTEGGSK